MCVVSECYSIIVCVLALYVVMLFVLSLHVVVLLCVLSLYDVVLFVVSV